MATTTSYDDRVNDAFMQGRGDGWDSANFQDAYRDIAPKDADLFSDDDIRAEARKRAKEWRFPDASMFGVYVDAFVEGWERYVSEDSPD